VACWSPHAPFSGDAVGLLPAQRCLDNVAQKPYCIQGSADQNFEISLTATLRTQISFAEFGEHFSAGSALGRAPNSTKNITHRRSFWAHALFVQV
jgi:hypothetical protein